MWYIREPNKTALVCGITGRSYTYRLSGSFNQRTVAIELACNMMLMLFFIVFVGVAVIVAGVGVGVIFVIVVVIVYFYQQHWTGRRPNAVPAWPVGSLTRWSFQWLVTKHQRVDFSFLDICPVTEQSVEWVDELTIKDYLLDWREGSKGNVGI